VLQRKVKVLFLCTHNSCRSQMAEGWARHLKGEAIKPYSAGSEARGLDARAAEVMTEAGVDIAHQRSKTLDELQGIDFDHVVTVCDTAQGACPVFPGHTKVTHVSFADPPRLAANETDEDEALNHYRCVRDEIRRFVEILPEALDAV